MTLEKKIIPRGGGGGGGGGCGLEGGGGLKPQTFLSRVRRSTTELSPFPGGVLKFKFERERGGGGTEGGR